MADRIPATPTGRALVDMPLHTAGIGSDRDDEQLLAAVLAIEAEAREQGMLRQLERQIHDEQQDGSALPKHQPRWEQSRDEDVGMWRCACGDRTFAPDDFGGYFEHLLAALPPSAPPALDALKVTAALNAAWIDSNDAVGRALPPDLAAHLLARLEPNR